MNADFILFSPLDRRTNYSNCYCSALRKIIFDYFFDRREAKWMKTDKPSAWTLAAIPEANTLRASFRQSPATKRPRASTKGVEGASTFHPLFDLHSASSNCTSYVGSKLLFAVWSLRTAAVLKHCTCSACLATVPANIIVNFGNQTLFYKKTA